MFGLGLDYHYYSIAELEEYKEAMLKTLEYVKKGLTSSIIVDVGFGFGGSSYETEMYLQRQISFIDAEIQKMLDPINHMQAFREIELVPHVYTSSSKNFRMDKIEERMDKIETKTDDVREEVHERLEEKMPRIDRVNNYLDSFEAEAKYNTDKDESD